MKTHIITLAIVLAAICTGMDLSGHLYLPLPEESKTRHVSESLNLREPPQKHIPRVTIPFSMMLTVPGVVDFLGRESGEPGIERTNPRRRKQKSILHTR
jgi:hypothetical protein